MCPHVRGMNVGAPGGGEGCCLMSQNDGNVWGGGVCAGLCYGNIRSGGLSWDASSDGAGAQRLVGSSRSAWSPPTPAFVTGQRCVLAAGAGRNKSALEAEHLLWLDMDFCEGGPESPLQAFFGTFPGFCSKGRVRCERARPLVFSSLVDVIGGATSRH